MAEQIQNALEPNLENLIQMGINAASENPQGARMMFQQVLSQDPRNERALLWMAQLTKDKAERRRYLIKVLKVNAKNQAARTELQRMKRQEKAKSNRTMFYGGVAVAAVVLLMVTGIVFILLLNSF